LVPLQYLANRLYEKSGERINASGKVIDSVENMAININDLSFSTWATI